MIIANQINNLLFEKEKSKHLKSRVMLHVYASADNKIESFVPI